MSLWRVRVPPSLKAQIFLSILRAPCRNAMFRGCVSVKKQIKNGFPEEAEERQMSIERVRWARKKRGKTREMADIDRGSFS